MEQFPEPARPPRWSPESHGNNVARKIEGGPYELELAPEFQGAIMFHLHGVRSDVRDHLHHMDDGVIAFHINEGGDAFLFVSSQHFPGPIHHMTQALSEVVDSMEAYPIVEVQHGRL